MSTQEQRSATMRTRVLLAAETLVSEQGYAAATLKAIAAAAGVSVGALQYQFTSKSKLMAAVTEQLMASRIADYRAAIRRTSLSAGVDALLQVTWDIARDPKFVAMLEIALARRYDAELREDTEQAFSRAERLLGRWSAHLWRRYGIPAEVAIVGRRLNSALLTGLALRGASGLDRDPSGLIDVWRNVQNAVAESPVLQALLIADPKTGR